MNKLPMVSVIIPVYNVEKYLKECLESLLCQTYKNIEIIFINDGSTDQSKNICEQYEKNNLNVKLINQKNQGVSFARNKALKEAKGEYIIFVDADDYCESNMIEVAVQEMENDTLVIYGYNNVYINKVEPRLINDDIDITNVNEMIITKKEIGGFLWNKVFIRKNIIDNKLFFNTKIHHWEDVIFVSQYIKHIKQVKYINKSLYNYRMRASGSSYDFLNKKNATVLNACEYLIDFYKSDKIIQDKLTYVYIIDFYKLKGKTENLKINYNILNQEKNKEFMNGLSKGDKYSYYIIKYAYFLWKFLRYIKHRKIKLFD